MTRFIQIKGARVHNLKNIDINIPRNQLVVITGPSGSGKSSLAFDTLYAEGQRRYVESLSAYARQFLERMPKPDVDQITGISPAIAIEQKNRTTNPRSTVGTVTEIYDYLRLLFARVGKTYCPQCGKEIRKETPTDAFQKIQTLPEGTRLYITFPLIPEQIQDFEAERNHLIHQGFLRLWRQGKIESLEKIEPAQLSERDVYIVVDRMIVGPRMDRTRTMDSLETAFDAGEGYLALITSEGEIYKFNRNFECSQCGIRLIEPQPRLFSFNNPFGACPGCQGFGDMMDIDLDKVVPDKSRSLRSGAIAPWNSPHHHWCYEEMMYIAPKYGIPVNVPFDHLKKEHIDILLNGVEDFPGIRGFFRYLEKKKYKVHVRVFIARYRSYFTCRMCGGARLRPEALQVRICGKNISELANMNIAELYNFFEDLKLNESERQIAAQLLKEIRARLKYLLDVGLDYLHLNRRATTLSGGEFQRINLATALGSALTSSLYVLDEPTVGLHARDTRRLIKILKSLKNHGNTVVVVEHDREVMQAADQIIDLGPGSGEWGGEVVFQGKLKDLLEFPHSLTAQYLRGDKKILTKTAYNNHQNGFLKILGAQEHNLKNIDVEIPLGKLVCITGVSGSGKSTLVHDILYLGIQARRGKYSGKVGKHRDILGLQHLYNVEMVDQSPIGRTPRSNPITYIKGFDEIRKLFANTPVARARGYRPGHFSFNVPGGRCEVCQGDGQIKVEMQFLADVYLICDACKGKRYKPEILDVKYQGKNIDDVLNMTIDEAMEFFHTHPRIIQKLRVLSEVGLGYLRLGQPATTLSGGEAQRIKLAAHLTRQNHRNILYIFDEPTTGLHFDDIVKLLQAFDKLIEKGASLIVIEHNLDVIQYADYIIDLGPEGGDRGGRIVAQGPPPVIARHPTSYTGKFLRQLYFKELKIPETGVAPSL